MLRISSVFLAIAFIFSISMSSSAQDPVMRSAYHDYRAVTVAEGLEHPWAIAFLPDGDMLVTERPGRLRIVRNGELLETPVPGVPEVLAEGQGGLMDVMPHPDFASNRLLYLTFSKPLVGEEGATTAIVRGRFENDRLTDVEEIFVSDSRGRGHYGSRLAFDENGYLFFSNGDRQVPPRGDLESHPAQDLSNHHGTINRIHDDGRIPEDNPFVGQEDAEPEIWSYGHRNPQGLAFHPETGDLWSNEHGPQGGDEVNLIRPGLNYGWPVVGYGVNYRSGSAIHEGTQQEGMENPAHVWVPSIGVSGLMIYTGDRFPHWRGSLFSGGLSGQQLSRLPLNGQEIGPEETLYYGQGRIRDVRQGPDGYIYLAVDDRQGEPTPIVRLEPADEPEFEPIFNGENLDGWHLDGIEADKSMTIFTIEDGELILDTPGTEDFLWLTYNEELTDFALRLKFIAYKDRVGNCGVQFRDEYVNGEYPRHGFDLASNVPQSTGFIWDFTEHWLPYPMEGYRAENFEPYLPEGWTYKWSTDEDPWNEFEVHVVGSRVTSFLNGKKIIDWDGGDKIRPTGHIAIEVHRRQDFKFRFKDIELAELSD